MKLVSYNPRKLTGEILYKDKIFLLSEEACLTCGVDIRKEIPEENISLLIEKSQEYFCRVYLYDQIASYLKTAKGYYDKLINKGFPKKIAAEEVKKAKENGYIDDASFAENYIKTHGKNKGVYRLKNELKQKGVSSEIIEDAVKDLAPDADELLLLAEKAAKSLPDGPAKKSKVFAKLARRGYPYEAISSALSVLFSDIDD